MNGGASFVVLFGWTTGQVVFGHSIAQRVPGHFEQPTSLRHVATGLLQGFLDHGPLDLFNRESVGEQGWFRIGRWCGWWQLVALACRHGLLSPEVRREVLGLDLPIFAQNGHPFDGIMKFPDITWPWIRLQERQRV